MHRTRYIATNIIAMLHRMSIAELGSNRRPLPCERSHGSARPQFVRVPNAVERLHPVVDDLDEQVSVALGKNAMRPQPGTSR